jgi:hypothetical protein
LRFVDLLKTTVLLSMGAATTLAVLCVAAATADYDEQVVLISAGWWVIAGVLGTVLGRPRTTLPAIGRLLADAKVAKSLPEHRPSAVLANRLWPMVLLVVVAGGLAVVFPQLPGIAAGFFIVWALYWRNQASAVSLVEERDGVTFYVDRTSPVRPVQLVRTHGFRREVPTLNGAT